MLPGREKARLRRRRARVRKICNPWLVRGRESCRLVLLLLPLRLIQPTHPPHSFFYSPPTDNRARRGEEAPLPPPRRRRGRRHGDEAERDLGGVLLGVVEVLAVVPEPGLVDRAVDGHAARPGCATTWFVLISWSAYLAFVGLLFPTLRTSVGTSGLVVACPVEVDVGLGAGLPLLSETIWNEGEAIWYSRHASVWKC